MFSLPTARSYRHALHACLTRGTVTPSRVGAMDSSDVGRTKELQDLVFEWAPGDEVYRPGYSRRLALVEALHLLSGTFDPAHFRAVAPKVGEGFFTAQMAYGPRVYPHLDQVSGELRDNPHSRRAVVFVSDNESWPPPCTNSFQWLIRDDRLNMVASMRSWDLWLGLPYDIFMFGVLHLAMARVLGVPTGRVRVHAASAHLYEKHWEKATAAVLYETAGNEVGSHSLREGSPEGWDGKYHPEFWGLIGDEAEEGLESCPWRGPGEWERVQREGLVQFR